MNADRQLSCRYRRRCRCTCLDLNFLGCCGLLNIGAKCLFFRGVRKAAKDRSVRLWDVGTGRPLGSRSMPAQVHGLSAGPSASELFVASGNGGLCSLAASSFAADSCPYLGHTGAVHSCATGSDGSRIASCSDVDRVRIWETRTRQCVSQLHANRDIKVTAVKIIRRSHARSIGGQQATETQGSHKA